METIKKKNKRTKSYWLVAILVGLAIMAGIIWAVFYMNRSYDSDARAYVDGRIETGSNAVDQAVSMLDGSEPAQVVRDAKVDQTRIGLVFTGMTGDAQTDAAILKLLQENGIRASFALSAAEGLDDTEFVDELLDHKCELLSNGTDGESNLHTKSAHDMVEVLLKSREALSTSADISVPLAYCSSTELTSDVLRAASVGGYEAVLDPEIAHVLDESSFRVESDAAQFVGNLSGDTIVVVNLRGETEEIADESAVTAEKPAVDKQPDTDSTTIEQDEPTPILTQVEWLVQAVQSKNLETEYVSKFTRTNGSDLLRAQMNDADTERAAVWRYAITDQQVVGIGMRGMPKGRELDKLLSALKKQHTEMTFFLTEDELQNRKDDIARVQEAGCTIGAAGDMENLSREAVYDAMQSSAAALRPYTDSVRLYLAENDNLDAVRTAAQLLDMRVVKPQTPETPFAGALYLLDQPDADSLAALNEQVKKADLGMTDMQSVIRNAGSIPTLSAKETSARRRENGHTLAAVQNLVHTTERTVGLLFFGAGNETTVRDAVDQLTAHKAKGTFYLTLDELTGHPAVIEYILSHGNELGICYKANADYPQTFDAVMNYLNTWRKYAAWRYGADAQTVYIPSDEPGEETKEAVQVSGCTLVRSTYLVVKNEDKDITLSQVPIALQRVENMRVMRGSFAGFNMSFYTNDQYAARKQTILSAVLDGFLKQHVDTLAYRNKDGVIEDASRFTLQTVSSVLASPDKYTFCKGKQNVITLNKNVLTNMKTDAEQFAAIAKGYYGNVTVDVADKLPGFTQEEIAKLDKAGTFTNDKVLFLTFDDWGTEQSINELLYVLKKHNVKGTFFVKTQYVDANPNSLRAIAVEGHQIASHTDGHIPLAASDPKNENKMYSLTDSEAAALRKDLVTSYDKLYRYVGNVKVDGKKALTPMFRPPTLAVSKIGIRQVFDVGFQYSISGAYSTGDYEASSYQDMINRLTRRSIGENKYVTIQNGTVIVMHMQENAKYTAQALDTMIPIWKQQGYTFARIDDYLKEGDNS